MDSLTIDYGNIQSRAQLEDIVKSHQELIQFTIQQIHQLSNRLTRQKSQHETIINKMEVIMHENKTKILGLENNINETTKQHNQIMKQFEDEVERIKKNLDMKHFGDVSEHLKKIEELENEYKQLRELQEKEQKYQERINTMKNKIIQSQYEHHDNMNQEQQKQQGVDSSILQDNSLLIKDTKKNALKVAKEIILIQKETNQEKNQLLKEKLKQLQTELKKLKKQRNQILSKRKQLKINLCLNEEELQQYKAVGSLQKAKIKVNKDKVENLKKIITVEVSKREQKIQQKKKQMESNLKVLKLKMHKLEKEREQLKLNGQKLRVLGETILLQRQEVENFFLMAMESVKRQVQNKQMKSIPQKQYGEKVDIEELLPKDKQRIITNLYTKLALAPK